MVCPLGGHSPSNSTGGAYPRSVPSRATTPSRRAEPQKRTVIVTSAPLRFASGDGGASVVEAGPPLDRPASDITPVIYGGP